MSKHYHVYFYPGEQYSLNNDKIYLGFMLGVGEVVKTDTSIKFVNKSSAISSNDYVDFSVGKGLKISKKLPMALEGSMVGDGRGYVVPGLGFEEPKTIWFETNKDLSVDYAQYYGKIISFEDGSYDAIAEVPIKREPGTNLHKIVLAHGRGFPGAAEIGIAPLLPNKEIWWEEWMLKLAEIGSVGILELVYGVRDAILPIADQMTTIYSKKQYKSALMTAAVKGTYGDSPYFTYDLPVECSKFTGEEIIMATKNQKVQNVVASDREYSDGIFITWDDLPFATRYQVYANTQPTPPPMLEVHDQNGNNGYYNHTLSGLIAEIPGVDWKDFDNYFKKCGLFHGQGDNYELGSPNKYNIPADGESSENRAYPATGPSNSTAIPEETHTYFWVRALIDWEYDDELNDIPVWTDLSEMVHGCTKLTIINNPTDD